MKTYSPKQRDIERRWYILDASGAVLGRLATQAAAILRGKHKPIFAPHADTGDHVIVINAKDVTLTGDKERTKIAYRHSGYPGGLTETPYERLLATRPVYAVEKAIKGMLPKNRLGRQMARKLRVYAGPDHRHAAQAPQPLARGEMPTWNGLPEPASGPTGPAAEAPPKEQRRPTAASAPVSKTTAKRAPAKRSTAKRTSTKTTTKRMPPKRTTAKRSTAKRSAAARGASRSKKES